MYVVPPNLFGSIVIFIVFVHTRFLVRAQFLTHVPYLKSSTYSKFYHITTYCDFPTAGHNAHVSTSFNNEFKGFFLSV